MKDSGSRDFLGTLRKNRQALEEAYDSGKRVLFGESCEFPIPRLKISDAESPRPARYIIFCPACNSELSFAWSGDDTVPDLVRRFCIDTIKVSLPNKDDV